MARHWRHLGCAQMTAPFAIVLSHAGLGPERDGDLGQPVQISIGSNQPRRECWLVRCKPMSRLPEKTWPGIRCFLQLKETAYLAGRQTSDQACRDPL